MVARGLVLVLLVGAGITVALRYDLGSVLSQESLRGLLDAAGPAAPLAFLALMAAAVVVSPIPTLPLDVAAGAYWGPWVGTLLAAIGALLGAMAAFGVARLLGRDFVGRFLGGHVLFCSHCSDRLLTQAVLISRLIPVVSFDLVSYGAGLTGMTFFRFSVATFVGSLPLTFLYTSSGPLLISGGWISVAGGVAMVALFLLLPRLIEKTDLFGLSRMFSHPPEE